MGELKTSKQLIKQCIKDLYLDPRNLILKWSKITNQTSQIRIAYPGQHLASVVTGIKGTGTAARGDDLSDGSEVKTCSRADQLSECLACGAKVLPWQKVCTVCGSTEINIKTDSHWIISIKSEEELRFLLKKVPRIILILFDRENQTTSLIRLRIWIIDPRNNYVKAFFKDYFFHNYLKKTNPAPCNLHPFKFDFFMMEPALIFSAEIDIEKKSVGIKHWDLKKPTTEKMPIRILRNEEIAKLFYKELKQGMTLKEIKNRFQYVPDDKRKNLNMRKKVTTTHKRKYTRR